MMKLIALSNSFYPNNYAESSDFRERRLTDLSRCMKELSEQTEHISRIIGSSEPVQGALFKDTEFLSAHDKRKVLYDWGRFIKNGYGWACFTDRIYRHLSLHCGYIAHYNRMGFYQTYWREDVLVLVKEHNLAVRPVPATFYNWVPFLAQFSIWHDYNDINLAMMYSLRSQLISLRKELENEVIVLFQKEVKFRLDLTCEKKDYLNRRIEELIIEVDNLQAQLAIMNPETFMDERILCYRKMFPSIDEQAFTPKALAGNLF